MTRALTPRRPYLAGGEGHGFLRLAVLLAALVPGAVPTEGRGFTAPPVRRLVFPAERSVGRLYTRPDTGAGRAPAAWEYRGDAKGSVVIPPGLKIRLDVEAGAGDLASLARIGRTALTELSLAGQPVGDDALRAIWRMDGLRVLRLGDTQVGDSGVAHLAGLSRLEVLELGGTRVTDAALPYLAHLPRLRVLSLSGMRRSGSLRPLARLAGLESLYLRRAAADRDLVYLGRLRRLRQLHLTGCPITDVGLRHLAGLTELESLDLDGSRITDHGLTHLARLSRLQQFQLSGSITDAGFAALARLPALRRLQLGTRGVSAEAVDRVHRAKPRLREIEIVPVLLEVGGPAPPLALPTVEGRSLVLKELLKQRKAVLVNFWYLGCGPCRVELPLLQRLYPELQRRGVELVAVNTFDPAEEVTRYLQDAPLAFPVLLGGTGGHDTVGRAFGVRSYPTNYLIGAGGTVLWADVGFHEASLRRVLDRL